jgi:hypothetical protein
MPSEPDAALASELSARAEVDQEIRYRLIDAERKRDMIPVDDPLDAEMHRIFEDNIAWFKTVVDHRGWPLSSEVGEDAARAAWLFTLHGGDLEFVERCAGLLRDAVAHGEADPKDLAWLEDRVNMHKGKPQRYGSQWINEGRGYELWPLEDSERVEVWRAELEIGPVAGRGLPTAISQASFHLTGVVCGTVRP